MSLLFHQYSIGVFYAEQRITHYPPVKHLTTTSGMERKNAPIISFLQMVQIISAINGYGNIIYVYIHVYVVGSTWISAFYFSAPTIYTERAILMSNGMVFYFLCFLLEGFGI